MELERDMVALQSSMYQKEAQKGEALEVSEAKVRDLEKAAQHAAKQMAVLKERMQREAQEQARTNQASEQVPASTDSADC